MHRSAESSAAPQTSDSSLLSNNHQAPVVRRTATTNPQQGDKRRGTCHLPSTHTAAQAEASAPPRGALVSSLTPIDQSYC